MTTFKKDSRILHPITVGVWNDDAKFQNLNRFRLENSDVIIYHNYNYIDNYHNAIDPLRKFDRPLICTEYRACRRGRSFQVIMAMLKEQNVGAINRGFVSRKTNTIFAWETPIPIGKEPVLWLHAIYRKDKTLLSTVEVRFLKNINKPGEKTSVGSKKRQSQSDLRAGVRNAAIGAFKNKVHVINAIVADLH